MSAQEKQSFTVDELDCDVVQGLIEKLRSAKLAVDTHITALAKARANYDKYMDRLSKMNGVDALEYRINFATKQLEPIPPPPPAPVVVLADRKAPDAGEPPAPFKEIVVVDEPQK